MRRYLLTIAAAACLAVAGPSFGDPDKDESGKGRGAKEQADKGGKGQGKREGNGSEAKSGGRGREGNSYFHRNGYSRLAIPPGHYPPPGQCRVWYPDRPPGHQPPPGRCGAAPAGAWLIRHPQDRPGHAIVTVYQPAPATAYVEARPVTSGGSLSILAMGEFEIASGVLMRVMVQN